MIYVKDILDICKGKLISGSKRRKCVNFTNDTRTLKPGDVFVGIKGETHNGNAFYKDAKIYLFDDATSKFDATTEKEMMDEILKLKNKITVIVSNRINSLVKCSKILILNGGKVVEYGETAALINDTKSAFSKMVKEAKTSRRIS